MKDKLRPQILNMAEMGKLVGWSAQRVRETLQKQDMAFQIDEGKGKPWYVTLPLLRARMPEVHMVVVERLARGALNDE